MKTWGILLILILFFGIGLYIGNKTSNPEIVSVIKRDTIKGDSIPYPVEITKPVPTYIDTGSIDTILKYKDVDTLAILKDYYTKRFYNDTILSKDSSVFIIMKDSVTRNRITYRKPYIQNRRETKIINKQTVVTYNRDGIYLGFNAGLSEFGGDIMYLKNRNMIGAGVDIMRINQENKYFFKIKYKRQIWKKP